MDYEWLDDLADLLSDEVAADMHAMANEMAERVLANYIAASGRDIDIDDQMMIVSIIENNWTYHV